MLKTSPIPASSANASPNTSFRHAPPRPPSASPRQPAPTARRPSLRPSPAMQSMRPDGHSLPVDAHGPRRNAPLDIEAGDDAATHSPQTSAAPPAPPPQPADATASVASSAQLSTNVPTPHATGPNPLSPNKRRGSPSHDIPAVATRSGAGPAPESVSTGQGQASSAAPKRLRPEEPPAKRLPLRYELCATEDMVELIAHMISELIATNDAIRVSNGSLTRFHSRTAPGISVRDYLHRLARHATLIPPLLLAMVYYIDRLCALYPEFTINTLTVHRFLITAATVAAKGLSDAFWNNTTYARVGGVRVAELKLLELDFLYRLDWKIIPNPEVLVAYYRGLVERTPGYTLEEGATPASSTAENAEDEADEDDSEGTGQDGDSDE